MVAYSKACISCTRSAAFQSRGAPRGATTLLGGGVMAFAGNNSSRQSLGSGAKRSGAASKVPEGRSDRNIVPSDWRGKQRAKAGRELQNGVACSAAQSEPSSPAAEWDGITTKLVDSASVPFTFLLLPQVYKNLQNLLSGNSAALAILSVEGYFVSFLGNVMLMSYFVGKFERGAVLIQGLGVASNFAMLTQIFIAGYLPSVLYNAGLAATTICFLINISKLAGRMESEMPKLLWSSWQSLLGIVGLAVLPQVLWLTFTESSSILLGCVAGAAGLLIAVLPRFTKLPVAARKFKAALGACTATLLFMLQPVAQLMQNFTNPASLEGLSITTCVLAMVGNALMVPRALFTKDLIWFTGSTWGYMLMGWGQLLSLFLGRNMAGERFLGALPFAISTVLAFGYLIILFRFNSRSLGLTRPGASLARLEWPREAKLD